MDEFSSATLGNGWQRQRFIKLAMRFGGKPTTSIPRACADWGGTQVTYRLFDRSSAGKQALDWGGGLAPRIAQIESRTREHPVVLCMQDTSVLGLNGQDTAGLRPPTYEALRGMYLHPTYVATPGREPLGVVDTWMWPRGAKGADGIRRDHRESLRWIENHESIAERGADNA